MTNDVLTAFSPGAEFLAVTTGDGRVKTWDVGNGHLRGEFVDITASTSGAGTPFGANNGHLAVEYLCMAWASLPAVSKKGKKKGLKEGSLILALGTRAGDVLAWDTALGQLKWRTNDCNSGGVNSLAFSKSGQILYTAGSDGMICELNSESGEVLGKFRAAKTNVSSLAVSPDGGSLLTASAELKLFDLSSKKRIRKFAGHPVAVTALAFSQDGKYALSCATEERQVALWQVEGSKADRGALFSLSLDNAAVALDCSSQMDKLTVVAVSGTGTAYIWQAQSADGLATVKPMKVSVGTPKSPTTGKGRKPGIMAVHLVRNAEASDQVLIARGTTVKPIFEKVKIGAPGTNLVLDTESSGALLPGNRGLDSTAPAKTADVTILGPDSAAESVLSRPRLESGDAALSSKKIQKKRRASVELDADVQVFQPQVEHSKDVAFTISEDEGDLEALKVEDDGGVDEDDEPTMEEKLVALGIVDKVPSMDENEGAVIVVPRADSVQVLLSQALQADDPYLLERCLAVTDEKVIGNTVRSLRPAEAAKFLNACVVKLETRPQRGLALVPWVRTVLLQHAASLMSNPAMQPVLTVLYQLIEARLSVFRPLLALSGRLDLIVAQISLIEKQETQDSDGALVYEEQDSEPEVEEVEDASSEYLSDKDEEMNSGEDADEKPFDHRNGHPGEGESDDDSD